MVARAAYLLPLLLQPSGPLSEAHPPTVPPALLGPRRRGNSTCV